MQVPPLPTAVLPTALPQEAIAKAIPQIEAQAAAPLIQRAVDPSPRSEGGQRTRSNNEKNSGGDKGEGKRGGAVNIRV